MTDSLKKTDQQKSSSTLGTLGVAILAVSEKCASDTWENVAMCQSSMEHAIWNVLQANSILAKHTQTFLFACPLIDVLSKNICMWTEVLLMAIDMVVTGGQYSTDRRQWIDISKVSVQTLKKGHKKWRRVHPVHRLKLDQSVETSSMQTKQYTSLVSVKTFPFNLKRVSHTESSNCIRSAQKREVRKWPRSMNAKWQQYTTTPSDM